MRKLIRKHACWLVPAVVFALSVPLSMIGLVLFAQDDGTGLPYGPWVSFACAVSSPALFLKNWLTPEMQYSSWMFDSISMVVNGVIGAVLGILGHSPFRCWRKPTPHQPK